MCRGTVPDNSLGVQMAGVPASATSWAPAEGTSRNGLLARWLIVLAIAAVAFILGIIGLNQYLSHQQAPPAFGRGWADILYYDLELYVFNAAPVQGPGPFPLTLQIARFLAPAVTVLAGVETLRLLLGEQFRRWASASAVKHAIVTGDGAMAVELARNLRKEYRKVVLVSASWATTIQARRHGLLDVSGDPADPAVLRAAGLGRADALYACAGLSATNAATALRAREISHASGRPLVTYALVRDAEICTALRARRIGASGDRRFHLDFFAVEDTAARVLLDRYPLAREGAPPGRAVIIGFGRLGRAVLREIARRPRLDASLVSVTVRGETREKVEPFLDLFPVIRRNCSVTCDGDPPPGGNAPTSTFVCLPGAEDALNAGLAAANVLTAPSDLVVICMSEPSPFGAVLTGQTALLDDVEGRLTVFEVIEEACMPARIREDLVDQLARAIHRAYVDNCAARGDSPRVNQSMRPWEQLPDDLKRANLAQAEHIGTKLESINCTVTPESGTAPAFAFTPDEIEQLAQMEHERWMQERRAEGKVYGPRREGNQHPDLVDWQYLSETAREKDRDAIRELPAILGEAGFQILRLPPRPE
jgi:TrkA-N domain/RyR domain